MAGIYIHIPFCKKACHYCNFHFSTSMKYKDEMVKAIVQEIHLQKDYLKEKNLESIYFGGGTPSLLDTSEISMIMDAIACYFEFDQNIEITLEANPDDLTKSKLLDLSKSQINRLSIGIQSFHQAELEWMNRAHSSDEAENCINWARDYDFTNMSLDLIYGVPISTHELWDENLEKVIKMEIPHISCYALTVEEGTALNHFVKTGKAKEADDNWVMAQFDKGVDQLTEAGFEHYEISNFAKPGFRAIHNTNYWKSVPYLGIGPSAHSYNGQSRSYNVRNNAKYLKSLFSLEVPSETEILDQKTIYNEYVMTRLRTIWGIDLNDVITFGPHFVDHFKKNVTSFMNKKWVRKKDNIFHLTREGQKYADGISSELFYVD